MLKLIEEEIQKLPDQDPSRIIIGGFSQGSIISLASLLRNKLDRPLGGVLALNGMNCYELNADELKELSSEKRIKQITQTPILAYNGNDDNFFSVPAVKNSIKGSF